MPRTPVVIFAEKGRAPLLEWMDGLDETVRNKLIARIDLLAERGHELRRPHADLLRDGIHELRAVSRHVNYRVLYFFHDGAAVLSHGITKRDAVPPKEIDLAMARRRLYAADPRKHTFGEER